MVKSRQSYHNEDHSGRKFSELVREVNFEGADFSYAKLCNTDFSNVNLRNANFAHAKINEAIFDGADLRGANFSQALVEPTTDDSLRGVSFCNSQIQGADFSKSVLKNANFNHAKAGLFQRFPLPVVLFTFISLAVSGFTASIASTFFFHFFLASSEKAAIPGQKPSLVNLLTIFSISVFIVTSIRILINNIWGGSGIYTHMIVGIVTIAVMLIFALTMSKSEADRSSLLIIAIIALLPLCVRYIPGVTGVEVSLQKLGLSRFVTGLGTKTEGAVISGFVGSITGALIGCSVSQLAICRDENIKWLNFDWLWRWYLKFVSAGGTNFNFADLTAANFTSATLKGPNFQKAIISNINWHKAKYLDCANTGINTYLKYPEIRHLLVMRNWGIQGNFEGLDLEGIYLEGIDLRGSKSKKASFVDTNLNNANLRHAILTDAILTKTSLDGADLTEANLTGACIQSWSIDERTKLEGVKCEYVFLKDTHDYESGIRDRLPNAADGENFKPGDFETLFKKDNSIVQLFIRDTDNREVLKKAFKQLIKNTDSVFQGFEIVGDSALVKIRVSKPSIKDAVSNSFYQAVKQTSVTQKGSKLREDEYQSLPWRDFVLNIAIDNMSENPKYIINNPTIGNFADHVQGNQIYTPEQRKTLSEAAAEIQQLFSQLAATNHTSSDIDIVDAVHQEIKRNPTLKARLVNALQSGGLEALKAIFNHPVFSIQAETVKGWLEAE